jgi:hypothetical protein
MKYRIRYSVATLEKNDNGKPVRQAGHVDVDAFDRKAAITAAKLEIAAKYGLPEEEGQWPSPESEDTLHQNRFSIEECGPCQKPDVKSKKK